jgi:hypothetical protein
MSSTHVFVELAILTAVKLAAGLILTNFILSQKTSLGFLNLEIAL